MRSGLAGWRIEGRDVIWEQARDIPCTAEEITRVAGNLVALARLFPPELFRRYGTAPTTDIPLAAGRR